MPLRRIGKWSERPIWKGTRQKRVRYSAGKETNVHHNKKFFNIVQELPFPFTLQRGAKHERAAFMKGPFKWLSFRRRGVWIVRLTQAHVVDHCVVIEALKRLIRGSASPYPPDLSDDVLRSRRGDKASRLRIAEVRELFKQEVSSNSNRKRK